MDYAGIEYPP